MFTSTFVIALASYLASTSLESPSWHADYGSAQRLGREGSKPLAVFIGSGKAGWNQLSREGELANDAKRLLAKNYICVYVDAKQESGKQLAAEFRVPKGPGLIISDSTGQYQAFFHRGNLSNEQLAQHLSRYADPYRVVRATETNPAAPPVYPQVYPAVAADPFYQPVPYTPVYSSTGSC
jgi:hypothetical protein